MPFNEMKTSKYIIIVITLLSIFLWTKVTIAELVDRVVAFVDDDAITLRELDIKYEELHSKDNTVTKQDILNTMVNQLLIERDAAKHRITGLNKEDIINKYLNIYVKSQVNIKDKEIDNYFNENIDKLQNIKESKDKIKEILTEKQNNVKLWERIKELKKKAYVRIQLDLLK
jgi:hypothetical protein